MELMLRQKEGDFHFFITPYALLQALTRIAGCVWMRWLLASHKHAAMTHSPAKGRDYGNSTSKVALGQVMSAEVLKDAVNGSGTALRVLHNTCTSTVPKL